MTTILRGYVIPNFSKPFIVSNSKLPKLTTALKQAGADLSQGLVGCLYHSFGLVAQYDKSKGELRVISALTNQEAAQESMIGLRVLSRFSRGGCAMVWDFDRDAPVRMEVRGEKLVRSLGSVTYETLENI